MHRCSSSSGNMVGPCSCGMYHSQGNCFSMLFAVPNQYHHKTFDEAEMYSFTSSSSSSSSSSASVDCTLSLGTPSTRSSGDSEKRGRSGSCRSNFCWDILQPKHGQQQQQQQQNHKTSRGNNSNNNSSGGGDPLLARRCANCDTTSTPLWRNGPRGPKSLCNACGIRFKKEERRATAAASTNASGGAASESQHIINNNNNSWVHHSQSQKVPYYSQAAGNEFRFIDGSGDDRESSDTTGIPFLSWRLNVTDRPSLIHDFTR